RVDADVAADVTVASENRIPDARLAADATIGPDHGSADDGLFLDLCLTADHGVRADLRARLYQHALVDEARALDGRAVFNLCIGRDERTGCRRLAERLGCVAAVHDAAGHLGGLARHPDVDPVAVVDVADERFAPFDERREIAPFDRPGDVARNAREGVRHE